MTPAPATTTPLSLVGSKIHKSFGKLGWFHGEITKTVRIQSKTYFHVQYEDGDREDLSEQEVQEWLVKKQEGENTKNDKDKDMETREEQEQSYMDRVHEKRQRNQAMLEQLGLLDSPLKQKKKQKVASPRKKKIVNTEPQRLSQRVRKKPALYADGLPEDWLEEHKARQQQFHKRVVSPSPKKKNKSTRKQWKSPLSEQYASTFGRKYQKSEDEPPEVTLPDAGGPPCDDEQYLEELREFLKTHHPVSPDNLRNVLKQAGRLCSGEGVTYHHWPDHVVFGKNLQLTMHSDLQKLYEQACDYEDFYGRDLGNGWLLKHPIKKMIYFQDYWKKQKQPNWS